MNDPEYGLSIWTSYAPVICISNPLGAGYTGDIAGLKCWDLTSDESQQCIDVRGGGGGGGGFRCLDSILNIQTCQILNLKT